MSKEDAANQTSEDGAQNAANQTAEDSAQQQADDASVSVETNQDDAGKEAEGLKAAAVAERQKRQEAEAQLQAVQAQNLAYQQQMAQSQAQAQAQPKQPETTYSIAVRELGLSNVVYPSQDELSQVFARKDQLDAQNVRQQQVLNQNAQFTATHPDYGEVVGSTVGGVFVASQEVNALLLKKPWLRDVANSSAQAVYDLVMQERQLAEYTKNQTVANERDNRQKADAITAPMSARGGAGGVSDSQFTSAEDVQKMEARLAAGEFPTNRQ